MRHGYEQELGDLWGLLAQNDFLLNPVWADNCPPENLRAEE